jgi:hypothetical protein
MSDRALAEERLQKGQLDQMSIQTKFNESEHQKAGALLEKAKAAKEIESMGIDDFVKVFSLIQNIQNGQDKENQEKGKNNGTQS